MSGQRKSSGNGSTIWQLLVTLLVITATAAVMGTVLSGAPLPSVTALIDKVTGKVDDIREEYTAGGSEPAIGGPTITSGSGGTGTPSPDPSTLTVAAPASTDGYARLRFGQSWTDDVDVEGGHNQCDTRNDILRRDLTQVQTLDGCKVATGTLTDPYTGTVISFVRGKDTSADVQVDHLVALANAWVSGAWNWDLPQLKQIANDPLNLLAVDGPANMGKGAKAADEWLPPNAAFQCIYVKRQTMVKNKYRLTVTTAEKQTMMAFYGRC